jgi:hypothetical protein
VSGNSTTFCNSTGFISPYFSTLPNLTTTTIAFQGQYRVILTNTTNFAQTMSNCVSCPTFTPFIGIFRTTTQNETVTLPYVSTGTYSGTIDWGDNTTSINSFANSSHVYSFPGTYTIRISGVTNGWSYSVFFNPQDPQLSKITEILQWGNQFRISNVGQQFYSCTNLVLTGVTDVLNLDTTTTNLSEMFRNCTSLTTINNINSWNVSNVRDMRNMFNNAVAFNQNIGNWDTKNVNDMSFMFMFAKQFNNGGINTINNWITSAVTNMTAMFQFADNFNQPIGNWDVRKVTTMNAMFNGAIAFNQNIGNWNVSAVTNFNQFMLTKTPLTFSSTNLNAIYNGWTTPPKTVKPSLIINFGSAKYTSAGQSGRNILTGSPNNWTITDGGI